MTLWEATDLLEAAPLDDFAAVERALNAREAAWAGADETDLSALRAIYERGQRVLQRWRRQRAQWAAEAASSGQERKVYEAFTRA